MAAGAGRQPIPRSANPRYSTFCTSSMISGLAGQDQSEPNDSNQESDDVLSHYNTERSSVLVLVRI